jgi:hypothetical protein
MRWCPVLDTCDLDGRVSTMVPVLWLCGPPGVGKTAVGWEVYTRLVRARRAPAYVVERTFAWLTAHRRLARDDERDPAISEAMIRWAAINTITRRIARGGPATRQQRRTFTTSS